jgi:hypothetical protein
VAELGRSTVIATPVNQGIDPVCMAYCLHGAAEHCSLHLCCPPNYTTANPGQMRSTTTPTFTQDAHPQLHCDPCQDAIYPATGLHHGDRAQGRQVERVLVLVCVQGGAGGAALTCHSQVEGLRSSSQGLFQDMHQARPAADGARLPCRPENTVSRSRSIKGLQPQGSQDAQACTCACSRT